MTTQHTPGPWSNGAQEEIFLLRGDARQKMWGIFNGTSLLALANKPEDARLIAAAPAMAEAIAALFALGNGEIETPLTLRTVWNRAEKMLRAALDKATDAAAPPRRVTVTLCLPDLKPGDAVPIIASFNTVSEAEHFLATSATIDPDHLAAGYYGIDADAGET